MTCTKIIQVLFIMFILWILFLWLHYISHGADIRRNNRHGLKYQFTNNNQPGTPKQPHSTDSVVLIPAVLGLNDLYPPTIPGNSPRSKKFICPQGYIPNNLQNFTSDKACIYEKAIGIDKYNIGGFPFFSENSTVYNCPTGQKKIKGNSIKAPNACTGDAGTNYAKYVGPQFSKMYLGNPFIDRNRH